MKDIQEYMKEDKLPAYGLKKFFSNVEADLIINKIDIISQYLREFGALKSGNFLEAHVEGSYIDLRIVDTADNWRYYGNEYNAVHYKSFKETLDAIIYTFYQLKAKRQAK